MTCQTALIVTTLAMMASLAVGAYANYRLMQRIAGLDKDSPK